MPIIQSTPPSSDPLIEALLAWDVPSISALLTLDTIRGMFLATEEGSSQDRIAVLEWTLSMGLAIDNAAVFNFSIHTLLSIQQATQGPIVDPSTIEKVEDCTRRVLDGAMIRLHKTSSVNPLDLDYRLFEALAMCRFDQLTSLLSQPTVCRTISQRRIEQAIVAAASVGNRELLETLLLGCDLPRGKWIEEAIREAEAHDFLDAPAILTLLRQNLWQARIAWICCLIFPLWIILGIPYFILDRLKRS